MKHKNLLIIHHGALGDLVVTFPIIIRLKKKYPQIDILCQFKLGKLAQSLHIVDAYFSLESAPFASLFTATVDPVVKRILCSYQDILLFSNSFQLEAVISAATERPVHRILPRPKINGNNHVTQHILSQLLASARFGGVDTAFLSIQSSTAHPDRRNPHYDPLKVLLHPGSGSPKKCWPVSNFINLASFVESKGKRVAFILGPAEHTLEPVLAKQDEHKRTIHKLDSLTQLSSILQTANGFVGNDSGVSHLSAFLGLPTVVVFGPSDSTIWRPIGRSVRIVRPDLECLPCFETDNGCEEWECFGRTTPEMVLDVLIKSMTSDQVEI